MTLRELAAVITLKIEKWPEWKRVAARKGLFADVREEEKKNVFGDMRIRKQRIGRAI